ncbi:MAG TPA: hypothetical protein PKL83_06695 [bacterium]|nr:hypothetical protein [bacterium]
MDNQPQIELPREQLQNSLQERLMNYLTKLLDQAGLLAEKAGEALRNIIPQSIPFPPISLMKLLRICQFRQKDPNPQHTPPILRKKTRHPQASHRPFPFSLSSSTT